MFIAKKKQPNFGPSYRLRIWGVPPSPPLQIFFSEKGVTDFGGTPPPFANKIRKVVFEVLPKSHPYFWINSKMHRLEAQYDCNMIERVCTLLLNSNKMMLTTVINCLTRFIR